MTTKNGQWWETTTLFLVLDRTPAGWRGRSVGLWISTDVFGGQQWIAPLSGVVTIDSRSCDLAARLRCKVDLTRFSGTFEVSAPDSTKIAERLEYYAGAPTVRAD